MNPLIAFYRADLPDSQQRWWADIVGSDDTWLEQTHDYIQWLFPLTTPSAFNPGAPLVDAHVIEAFRADGWMRQRLGESFIRMLRFYGLVMRDGRVEPAPNGDRRRLECFGRPNHNFLRITRILTSLTLLGLPHDAMAFFECLKRLKGQPGFAIDDETFGYWQRAVGAAAESTGEACPA